MNIKQSVNNPKLWQALTGVLTAVLSYFGYVQVAENSASSIDVEVIVPEQSDNSHSHRNWQPSINEAIKQHNREYH